MDIQRRRNDQAALMSISRLVAVIMIELGLELQVRWLLIAEREQLNALFRSVVSSTVTTALSLLF